MKEPLLKGNGYLDIVNLSIDIASLGQTYQEITMTLVSTVFLTYYTDAIKGLVTR